MVNQKGTRIGVDSSKWSLNGANIFNKNTGNVGVGIALPIYKLDVAGKLRVSDSLVANTARILNLSSGNVTDSILVADPVTGLVKRISTNKIIQEPWNKTGGIEPATKNADSIYIMGNVSIGKSSNYAQLDVKGRIVADSTMQAPNYISTVQTIVSGASFAWDMTKGANTSWTLAAGTNILTISNAKAGMYGLTRLINNGTSTLTFGGSTTNKVINGGLGNPALTMIASAVDILTFYFDGTTYWWTIGNNYN